MSAKSRLGAVAAALGDPAEIGGTAATMGVLLAVPRVRAIRQKKRASAPIPTRPYAAAGRWTGTGSAGGGSTTTKEGRANGTSISSESRAASQGVGTNARIPPALASPQTALRSYDPTVP